MELEEDADDVFEVDTITLAPKGKARKRLKTSENWKNVRAKRESYINGNLNTKLTLLTPTSDQIGYTKYALNCDVRRDRIQLVSAKPPDPIISDVGF
ncbi:hypothetical protein J6590_104336 [Homalodisca vitripennis]|nr:hypothetical protein J6590_104336 [Homalodisca vitripennis]